MVWRDMTPEGNLYNYPKIGLDVHQRFKSTENNLF